MNIIGVTSGNTLEIFYHLLQHLKRDMSIDNAGVYVANALAFKKISARFKDQLNLPLEILKEWEIASKKRTLKPNWGRVAQYEAEIGDPSFWSALVADRRIFFGKYCKYKQDYTPRLTYDQMVGILDQALCQIDAFIKELKPDIILGFTTATLGDYLFYLFAKARGIPYLLLKSTKIQNYVSLNDTVVGLSRHIASVYESQLDLPPALREKCQSFIDSVISDGVNYEGAISKSRNKLLKNAREASVNIAKGMYASCRKRVNAELRNDQHHPGHLRPALYQSFIQPLKGKLIKYRLRDQIVRRDQLSRLGKFVFYPLHFEPEVSLQVFGRPYQNQIELIRNIALSLPVGTRVLVKEHPRSIGFRPYSYYQRLIEIPNVLLVDPSIPAIDIVRHATVVSVVSGTIGFEAAICRKPVITFGQATYNILPKTMVRHIRDLNSVGTEILDLLSNYQYDEVALQKFIAATMKGSVPIDLYTSLLKKQNRHRINSTGKEALADIKEVYQQLASYYIKRINETCCLKK